VKEAPVAMALADSVMPAHSSEDILALRQQLDADLVAWQSKQGDVQSMASYEIWRKLETLTSDFSMHLCEQLR